MASSARPTSDPADSACWVAQSWALRGRALSSQTPWAPWSSPGAAPLLDRYLARTGFDSQQAGDKPATGQANLWHPADAAPGEDHGAHGAFDDKARPRSAQLWATQPDWQSLP